MIDYIEWANEKEREAQSVWSAIEKTSKLLEGRLSISERCSLRDRQLHLRKIYGEHMAAAERLRKRGASDNG